MKKLLTLTLALLVVSLAGAYAEKKSDRKPELSKEQQKVRKEILAKYDANKDGKLDKEERAKVSAADKEKIKGARKHGEHGAKQDDKKKQRK